MKSYDEYSVAFDAAFSEEAVKDFVRQNSVPVVYPTQNLRVRGAAVLMSSTKTSSTTIPRSGQPSSSTRKTRYFRHS